MKYGWNDGVMSTIDWEAHTTLLTATPILQRVTLAKFIHMGGWRPKRDGAEMDCLRAQIVLSVTQKKTLCICLNAPRHNSAKRENMK